MKCVLFDLDGTVADTEVLKAKALALAVQKFGGHAFPEIYKKVMGKSWEVVTDTFFEKAGIKVPLDKFNPVFREFYSHLIDSELIENRSIIPFISVLHSKGFSLGLVSSASPWTIEKALAKLNLGSAFEVIVSNADTDKHKPHPDAYLIALSKLKADPLKTIVFEDSESGFMAAKSAGLTVYGVRHIYNETHDFNICSKTISSFDECLVWEVFGD